MKKLLAIILVLVFVIGGAVIPASAQAIDWNGKEIITLKTASGKSCLMDPSGDKDDVTVYSYYGGEYRPSSIISDYTSISPTDKLVIKNIAGEELFIQLQVTPYSNVGDKYAAGHGKGEDLAYNFVLLDDGSFGAIDGGYLDGFTLKAGQSKTFSLTSDYFGVNKELVEIADDAYFFIHAFVVKTQSDFYDLEEFTYYIKTTGKGTLAPAGDITETPEAPAEEVSASGMIRMASAESYLSDYGYIYDFSVTNPSEEVMDGYYAMLSYYPKKMKFRSTGEEYYMAELYPMDVKLNPGESKELTVTSNFQLSGAVNLWVTFESKAERDAFVKNNGVNELASAYGDRYAFSGDAGEKLLKETFKVEFEAAK